MVKGPEKELFLELYEQANGDFYAFNSLLAQAGEETMAIATFYRRRLKWAVGFNSDSDAEDKDLRDTAMDEDTRPVAGGTIDPPDRRRRSLEGKRFVFTSAQNNTFVHEGFWTNLINYCEHNKAQLVIGKFRYNKSGFQNHTKGDDNDLWYDPKIIPYIIDESCVLSDSINGLVWCGELDILPTAATPLTGLDNYTHTASSIVPHAKMQLKSVPVLKGDPIKMLYTTGAVTQRNYIQRKTGQKAEFHHVFGALLVEIDESGFDYSRQLVADSRGDFQDFTTQYKGGKILEDHRVEAINWGDIHAEALDDEVFKGCFGEGGMLDVLDPKYQFVHDLTDFKARNHHNIKNPHFLAEMHFNGTNNVQEGMRDAARFIEAITRTSTATIVVESNHDQAFRRWLSEADIRADPENAEYFHTYNAKVFRSIREGDKTFHVFEDAVRSCGELTNTTFLHEDDSFVICGTNGIECGMHGHRGPNGARGSANGLRNIGRKCNIGHSHSAAIVDGIYVAGISCKMDLGYNKGPSSWSHSHIVTYPNGKRTIEEVIVIKEDSEDGTIYVRLPGGRLNSWIRRKDVQIVGDFVDEENNSKDTNPKDAVGIRKAPMSTVPAPVMAEVGVAMLEGARKYGRHNYRVAGVRTSVYYDAAMRHLMQFWEGEDWDPDSGMSHVTKAIASLVVLRDAMINEMVTDDRPPKAVSGFIRDLEEQVNELFDKYPDAKEAYVNESK